MVKKEKIKGYRQLEGIIKEIMEKQDFPDWDFVNGVLSCKEVLGTSKLWYHFGRLLIVPEEKQDNCKAGELEELDEWNTLEDGTIVLIGIKMED